MKRVLLICSITLNIIFITLLISLLLVGNDKKPTKEIKNLQEDLENLKEIIKENDQSDDSYYTLKGSLIYFPKALKSDIENKLKSLTNIEGDLYINNNQYNDQNIYEVSDIFLKRKDNIANYNLASDKVTVNEEIEMNLLLPDHNGNMIKKKLRGINGSPLVLPPKPLEYASDNFKIYDYKIKKEMYPDYYYKFSRDLKETEYFIKNMTVVLEYEYFYASNNEEAFHFKGNKSEINLVPFEGKNVLAKGSIKKNPFIQKVTISKDIKKIETENFLDLKGIETIIFEDRTEDNKLIFAEDIKKSFDYLAKDVMIVIPSTNIKYYYDYLSKGNENIKQILFLTYLGESQKTSFEKDNLLYYDDLNLNTLKTWSNKDDLIINAYILSQQNYREALFTLISDNTNSKYLEVYEAIFNSYLGVNAYFILSYQNKLVEFSFIDKNGKSILDSQGLIKETLNATKLYLGIMDSGKVELFLKD